MQRQARIQLKEWGNGKKHKVSVLGAYQGKEKIIIIGEVSIDTSTSNGYRIFAVSSSLFSESKLPAEYYMLGGREKNCIGKFGHFTWIDSLEDIAEQTKGAKVLIPMRSLSMTGKVDSHANFQITTDDRPFYSPPPSRNLFKKNLFLRLFKTSFNFTQNQCPQDPTPIFRK